MKTGILIISALLTVILSCNENIKQNSTIDLSAASGIYISTEDPQSYIEIKNGKYYMHYTGLKTKADSIYDIKITDSIKLNGTNYGEGKCLRLKNSADAMNYKIITWNAEKISLIYLSRGNTLTYRKK